MIVLQRIGVCIFIHNGEFGHFSRKKIITKPSYPGMAIMLYYVLMGILQGLTEWLPVSSSGHLVITQELFAVYQERTLFDAILHLGTLVAALLYFRKDIKPLVTLKSPLSWKVLLASIPIIIIGFLFAIQIEMAFSSVRFVALLLIINGFILLLNLLPPGFQDKINMKNALIIGCFQVLALLPGISRSGTTITSARLLGIKVGDATSFSFFISFLPMGGAALYKMVTYTGDFDPMYAVGFIISVAVGYVSIFLLIKLLKINKFYLFGGYTLALGFILLMTMRV